MIRLAVTCNYECFRSCHEQFFCLVSYSAYHLKSTKWETKKIVHTPLACVDNTHFAAACIDGAGYAGLLQVLFEFQGPTLNVALNPVTCRVTKDEESGRNFIDFEGCSAATLEISTTPCEFRTGHIELILYRRGFKRFSAATLENYVTSCESRHEMKQLPRQLTFFPERAGAATAGRLRTGVRRGREEGGHGSLGEGKKRVVKYDADGYNKGRSREELGH